MGTKKSGFFSKLGSAADALASTAAEKASEALSAAKEVAETAKETVTDAVSHDTKYNVIVCEDKPEQLQLEDVSAEEIINSLVTRKIIKLIS